MHFKDPLIEGILIKRYKRFLADVELEDKRIVTAHTPNTGSMKGCCTPGSRVWLSTHDKPGRKYPLSWELVEVNAGILIGINTTLANSLIMEGLQNGVIAGFAGHRNLRKEVKYGLENSRVDFLLEDRSGTHCFIEVKNVTLADDDVAYFPDGVSKRGTKHLRELEAMVTRGHRGIIIYCVQRRDAREVRPAAMIDPEYARTLQAVLGTGVEALAYQAKVTPESITISHSLPVVV